ncbi:MAG: choline ABC transporter substrate-binding protein [Spirochaetaceae bacterium]
MKNFTKTGILALLIMTLTVFSLSAGGQQEQAPAESQSEAEEEKETFTPVEDESLTVDLLEVQWTDIASTTAATRIVLEAIGYETTSKIVAVPIVFQALEEEDADMFLGDWEPTMNNLSEERIEDGSIDEVRVNLTGAKYTLAVPTYVAEGGLKSFEDIADYGEELDYKIYGIEPGNDGNQLIESMIEEDAFGLGDFELVESSEAGMLAQVRAMTPDEEWLVFLGWEPHPMNSIYDITYLEDGDDYFGPDYGAATVHTLTRPSYTEENPNVGTFLDNLEFSLEMENDIMKKIDDGMDAMDAAEEWLAANPAILEEWLDGVTTVEGKPALPAVRSALGLE